jgi:hypothetical protein
LDSALRERDPIGGTDMADCGFQVDRRGISDTMRHSFATQALANGVAIVSGQVYIIGKD